jgi:hypothetical protein
MSDAPAPRERLRVPINASVVGLLGTVIIGGLGLAWNGGQQVAEVRATMARAETEIREHAARLMALESARNSDAVTLATMRADIGSIREALSEIRQFVRTATPAR